jgi:hypothetical protein
MSESITISLTIILLGTLILLFHFPDNKSVFILNNVTIILFSSVKQVTVMLGFVIFLLTLHMTRRLRFQGKIITNLITFMLLIYLIFLSFSVDNISGYNLIMILGYRIMTNLEWKAWFESRGLPTNFLESMQVENSSTLNINGALGDSNIVQWLENQGMQDYVKFAFTHVDYLFFGPFFPQIFGDAHGFGSSLVWNSLLLENLVWGSFFYYIVMILALLISLATVLTKYDIFISNRHVKVNLFIILISILWSFLSWQLAPGDFTRTQFPSGLMLAVASGFLVVEVGSSVFKKSMLLEKVNKNI